jgi:hypothetical protein
MGSGVYVLRDSNDDVLYVGKSTRLCARISDHVNGRTHIESFHKEIDRIAVYFEKESYLVEMYETYLIHKLRPVHNISKVFHQDAKDKYTARIDEIEDEIYELMCERSSIVEELLYFDSDEYEHGLEDDTDSLGEHLAMTKRVSEIDELVASLRVEIGVLKGRVI